MEPGPDERLAGRGLALGDLVLVVREDQVDAAGVDVERRSEVAPCSSPSTRCASPAGPAPIAVSHDGSPGFGALPEREVADVVLAVLVGLDPLPDPQLLRIEPRQAAVRRPRGDPEEDRAVVGAVGVAPLEERRDQRDDLVDVVGRPRQDVRRASSGAPRRRPGTRASQRSASSSIDSPVAAAPRMILSSMSVMFMTQVTRSAAPAQEADEEVGEQERAEVADVGRAVDRRAAAVDAGRGRSRAARAAGSRPTACRGGGRHRRRPPASPRRSGGDRRARRPRHPSRLPVEALTLTRLGSRPSSSAIASRIASRWSAEPRPGGDDREVDRGRPPAGGRDAAHGPRPAAPRWRCRAASARPPGRGGRGRRGRRPRAARRRARGARRRRRSGRAGAARRRSRSRRAPAASPGPNGWLSCAEADARRRRRRRAAPRRGARSAGWVTLRLSVSRERHEPGFYRPPGGRPRRSTSRGPSGGNVRRPLAGARRGRPAASGRRRGRPGRRSRRRRSPVDPLERSRRPARPGSPPRALRPPARPPRSSAAETSGRAPSWTRTTRSRSAPRADRAGSSASTPAATDSWRRSPPATTRLTRSRQPGRAADLVDAGRRGDDDDPLDDRRRGERLERPGEHRPPGDRRQQLVDPRPSASTPRPRRRRRRPGRSARSGRAQSRRGWAKIIRPATVCRTRVTDTSRSLVDVACAALDDDHRAVVEEADALARLLALLDDPDAELLAGQDRRLDRVRQRVDVQDPDALQLGDAVEVEVVGQDRPAARRGERDELGVDLGDVGDVVLDDLDRRRRFLLHPVEDLETAPAAVAAQRVGAVGDVLELVEDEARDDERAVDEARFDDLGDPAVDDRARVDDDVRIAGRRPSARRWSGRRTSPIASAARSRSSRLATVRPTMPSPRNSETPSGSHVPSGAVEAATAAARAGGPSAARAGGR